MKAPSLALALGAFVASSPGASAFVSPSPRTKRSANDNAKPPTIVVRDGVRPSMRSTSPTALSAMAFAPPLMQTVAAAGAAVSEFYRASPLLAGFLTCSAKASVADGVAQRRDASSASSAKDRKFDPRRNLAMALYSGLVLGVSCELMYNRCFPILFGTSSACCASSGAARAAKMTLFDGFVNAPLLWLPPAYLARALAYGRPKREAMGKYVRDVRDKGLLAKYWSLWLPATMVNFLWVPAHFRVAFVAAVSFCWMIVLSLVANGDGGERAEGSNG